MEVFEILTGFNCRMTGSTRVVL